MKERWLMRVLAGMLVVAFLLAAASLAMARPVGAASGAPPQPMGCVLPNPVCSCGMICGWWRGGYCCADLGRIVDPCFGYEGPCNIICSMRCWW
ncbi:MAG: hypothetical protein ACPLYD_13915 [Anaerolineae bacterium]